MFRQRNTLGLLYATLELQFGLLRATTPFYSQYALKPSKESHRFKEIESDSSPIAKVIRNYWKKGTTWYNLDVVEVVEGAKVDRSDVIRTVNRWEMSG